MCVYARRYVDVVGDMEFMNLDAAVLLQTGVPLPKKSGFKQRNMDALPLFKAGLDGVGQVVGFADSGLDTNNCYFRDDGDVVRGLKQGETYQNLQARKVIQYVAFADGLPSNETRKDGTRK